MLIKKIIFLLILISVPSIAQDEKMNSVSKLIQEIKNQFAPDKRVALFEVNAIEEGKFFKIIGETNIPIAKEKLLKELKLLQLQYKDEIKMLPAAELGDKIYGVVNLSVTNMRIDHRDAAELVTQATLGIPVKILKKKSGYYLVQTPDNYIAWDESGITPMNKEEFNAWMSAEKIVFNKEFGFSYSKPDPASLRVSDLALGNILIKLGAEKNYWKVKYPDGRIAFIEKENCNDLKDLLNQKFPSGEDIVSTAKLFMGIPYLWGGTSIKAMDCSGFTKTVYAKFGIILARDASQQVNTGEPIDTKNGFGNLVPGDLLFFGTQATDSTKEKITHVGIYMGNNKFIHASGRVKINSLDESDPDFSEYRLKHYIRSKRILTSIDKNGITTLKTNKFYVGEF